MPEKDVNGMFVAAVTGSFWLLRSEDVNGEFVTAVTGSHWLMRDEDAEGNFVRNNRVTLPLHEDTTVKGLLSLTASVDWKYALKPIDLLDS